MAEETPRYVVVNAQGARVSKKSLLKEEAERDSNSLNESLGETEKVACVT